MTVFTKVCSGHIPTNIILVYTISSSLVKIYFIFVLLFTPVSSKMCCPELSSDSIVCMSCKINTTFPSLCEDVRRFMGVLTSEILFTINVFGS